MLGKSQTAAPNYTNTYHVQNNQVPFNDAPWQTQTVTSTPDIAQVIQTEVERAIQKFSTKMYTNPTLSITSKNPRDIITHTPLTRVWKTQSPVMIILQFRIHIPNLKLSYLPLMAKKIWYARFEETAERKRFSEN